MESPFDAVVVSGPGHERRHGVVTAADDVGRCRMLVGGLTPWLTFPPSEARKLAAALVFVADRAEAWRP